MRDMHVKKLGDSIEAIDRRQLLDSLTHISTFLEEQTQRTKT